MRSGLQASHPLSHLQTAQVCNGSVFLDIRLNTDTVQVEGSGGTSKVQEALRE